LASEITVTAAPFFRKADGREYPLGTCDLPVTIALISIGGVET
jgi:hypothetical protein